MNPHRSSHRPPSASSANSQARRPGKGPVKESSRALPPDMLQSVAPCLDQLKRQIAQRRSMA